MIYDLFVIGGGINGAGIACDAAGRGLKVYLSEMNDFASGTSSKSSKLIHGGLRYLALFDFKLVQASLKEREILLFKAPHLVKSLPFVMPFNTKIHSPWCIKFGLWLYDHLAFKSLPPATLKLNQDETNYLKQRYKRGIKYYDCWTNDARMVINNLLHAKALGASVHNYQKCVEILPKQNYWEIKIFNKLTQRYETVQAKVIINAAGAWVDGVNSLVQLKPKLTLIQGSHIIVKKWYQGEHAYILPNKDHRVIFTIPVDDKVIIGTTDKKYKGDLTHLNISDEETAYLLTAVNYYFNITLNKNDILDSYSGVRALYDDGNKNPSKITRDYVLDEALISGLPYISILGGKITTYRHLAEKTVSTLYKYFPEMGAAWTKNQKFPSANFDKIENIYHALKCKYFYIPEQLLTIYLQRYGSDVYKVLNQINSINDLGQCFGDHLFEREIDYLIENEWARSLEDIILRRINNTSLILKNSDKTMLASYINKRIATQNKSFY